MIKNKKFWIGSDLGRDWFIAEAKSKKHLKEALIHNHNFLVEEELTEFGKTRHSEAKTLKETRYVIFGEFSKEDYESNDDSDIMFYANNWIS